MLSDDFPARSGARPQTTPVNPHTQLDQNAPVELQDRLREHALSLPGVRGGESNVSVPGAVAFFLDEPQNDPLIPDLFGGEWGHIHPAYDGSLHLNVPTEVAEQLIDLGWAEYHHVVTQGLLPPFIVMLYGPRDEGELASTAKIVEAAYIAAGGYRPTP
ncbi:MAG: luciferase family protein [Actinomycetota bacterium]